MERIPLLHSPLSQRRFIPSWCFPSEFLGEEGLVSGRINGLQEGEMQQEARIQIYHYVPGRDKGEKDQAEAQK